MSDSTINYAYNVGSDTQLTIVSNGQVIASAILTEFEAMQETTLLVSKGIDGVNRKRHLEEGWTGTLTWDRSDSQIDDYFAEKESGRYAGFRPPAVFIMETTTDPNSGVPAKYLYEGVTMKLDTIGKRGGDTKVDPKVSWACSRRVKVL